MIAPERCANTGDDKYLLNKLHLSLELVQKGSRAIQIIDEESLVRDRYFLS